MADQKTPRTFSIRITVLGVFLFIACLTAGIALGLQYHFSRDLAKTAAKTTFGLMAERTSERMKGLDAQSVNLVEVMGYFHDLEKFPNPEQERRALALLCGAMDKNPHVYAAYVGYESGDFFEVINLESGNSVRKALAAAPHDRWVVIKIITENGVRNKTTTYLTTSFEIRIKKSETTDYDPRERPWYRDALNSSDVVKTSPYIFANLNAPGVTYAKRIQKNQRVVAVDISLAGLSSFLEKQQLLPGSRAFLFNQKGHIITQSFHSKLSFTKTKQTVINFTDKEKNYLLQNPIIKASNEMDWPPFDFAVGTKPRGYSIDILELLSKKSGFKVDYVNGLSWQELMKLFKNGKIDLLHSLFRTTAREKIGVFSKQYIPMAQVLVVRTGSIIPSSISDLHHQTIAIPKGWATNTYLEEHHPEISRLVVTNTLEALHAVSEGRAYATIDSEPVIRYLITSYLLDNLRLAGQPPELANTAKQGLHFLVQPQNEILVSILNKALASITVEEHKQLHDKWFSDTITETADARINRVVPHPKFLDLAFSVGPEDELQIMNINNREYLGYAAPIKSVYGSNEFLGILVPVNEIMRPYIEKVRFSLWITLGLLLLLTPIVWYCATIIVKPINALALESDKVKNRRFKEVELVESNITEILGLSTSMVSMASAIETYEVSLRELMDSLIKLIANAIDQKSPYTGSHCARVPKLSIMLAKAASNCTVGNLAKFSFTTEDEWSEFRTAAWLHDCGKVITPEHIVDKSTKLETIYNRIHEVRMRFEVLLRDAEIEYWKSIAQGGNKDILADELNKKKREIESDFNFIGECNLGGEFMDEKQITRIQKIGKRSWIRYLSDRLGLSHLELQRYQNEEPILPCKEPLLADRAEHIFKAPKKNKLKQHQSQFDMEAPIHLYNLGEIYNLCTTKGTLTAEDRYKINEHIITTIQMLETLPFPENMARVPEYAGGHHETLNGTGYPRKLTAKDISIPARIMAIADIFEALTASDRPYKKAKKLSEAIEILSVMVNNNHLDADLFKLFLKSGVYIEYANQFLDSSLVDEVDIVEYIEKTTTQSAQ